MRILLISGHGAGDSGATGTFGGRAWHEADETRRVTAAVAADLRAAGWEAERYPVDRNAYEDYRKGTLAAIAQFARYDYVLEIHFNAFRADPADGQAKGVECYVPTAQEDDDAAAEICRRVAALGLPNRGVRRKNWSVIAAAQRAGTPAALLEVCFIDDPDDMAIYTGQFDAVAAAIAAGLMAGLPEEEVEDEMTYETFCQCLDRYLAERAEWPPSAWSAAAREWAQAEGLLRGDGDGRLRYRSFVTREELAEVLYRALA